MQPWRSENFHKELRVLKYHEGMRGAVLGLILNETILQWVHAPQGSIAKSSGKGGDPVLNYSPRIKDY